MKIKDILSCTKGELLVGSKNKRIGNIRIDTRLLEENDFYITIDGNHYDAHSYIPNLYHKKLSGIMIDHDISNMNTNIPIIRVESTKKALLDIAAFIRKKNQIPLIAVTGSVGKTTTKEMIGSVLETKYQVLKNKGNHNNHIGVPLTLFELNSSYDMVITELGMNHSGEIETLSNICKPDVSIITNIGSAHIGNLGSKRNICKAKMEILKGMHHGTVYISGDDSYLKRMRKKKYKDIEIISCGIGKKNRLQARNVVSNIEGTHFDVMIENHLEHFFLSVPGKHLVLDALFAIALGLEYHVPISDIQFALKQYQTLDCRLSKVLLGDKTLIDDCYNCSYESLYGALELLKQDERHKTVILGDILELGHYSKKIHKKIGNRLKKMKNTTVLLVGNEMKYATKKVPFIKHFDNNQALIQFLEQYPINENELLLLKGSHAMHLEEIKAWLEKRYS